MSSSTATPAISISIAPSLRTLRSRSASAALYNVYVRILCICHVQTVVLVWARGELFEILNHFSFVLTRLKVFEVRELVL